MTACPAPCQPRLASESHRPHGIEMARHDQDKADRLAAALRENLKRRKAQARAAEAAEGPGGGEASSGPVDSALANRDE